MNNENLCEIVVGAGVTNNSGNSGSYGETFYVWTNAKTVEELQSAYLAGVEKSGVDVQKDCEGFIQLEDFQKIENLAIDGDLSPGADNLLAHKVEMTAPLEAFDDQPSAVIEGEPPFFRVKGNDSISLTSWAHYQLWRATARIGNPLLTMKIAEVMSLEIGGESFA